MRSLASCWVNSRRPSIRSRPTHRCEWLYWRRMGRSSARDTTWGKWSVSPSMPTTNSSRSATRVMLGLRQLSRPVIARVQGIATAAGCQLVASCDLAVAAEKATFATPGVNIGLFCTTPMVPLVQAIPAKAAMEMLLTGAPISAERAAELGLINQVVAADELDAAVKSWTDKIMAMSPLVIGIGKKAFYEIEGLDEGAAYDKAVPIMTDNALCHDAQEGIRAFLDKRPPQWSGT